MRRATMTCLAVVVVIGGGRPAGAQHAGLRWNGAGTCLQCHTSQALDVHASAHYQWEGATPYQADGPPLQGKIRSAVNSYCVNILGNWGGCGNCHVGRGAPPVATATPARGDLENIDCLVCHQKNYKRRRDPATGLFVPDTANMTVSMDVAVQTVHKPTRDTCLQCHAKGGGGDAYKRGDLALAHGTTADRAFDVHMASTGANLACQRCHTVSRHRMAGRGSDLRETDLDVQMSCANSRCHSSKASLTSGHSSSTLSRHTARVACQTCHVTTFARNAVDTVATEATEMHRDWSLPHLTASGQIHPTPTLVNNVRPVYRFWNRFSDNYSLGDFADFDATTGAYPTSRPLGAITDTATTTKLYPFKYKTASQPMTSNGHVLVPLNTGIYFASGNLASAVTSGLTGIGFSPSEPWEMVTTDTLQLITHEVQPKGSALTCTKCHGSTATQMNLVALGYGLKGDPARICTQCHEREDDQLSWQKVHDKHVTDKKYDCSFCHTFTRPERGLRLTRR